MKRFFLWIAVGLCGGCVQKLKIEPVTVQPIHVTVDVNLNDNAVKPTR